MNLNDDRHWKLGFGTDSRLARIHHKWVRRGLVLLIAFLLGLLIYTGLSLVTNKSADATYIPMQTASCGSMCNSTWAQKDFARRKFAQGKMGKSYGIAESRLFKDPAYARKVMIYRIGQRMRAAQSCTGTHCRAVTFAHSATWYYNNTIRTASCFGDSFYRPWTFGTPVCKRIQNPVPMSNAQVKRTGTVIFCSAMVGLAWETGGGSLIAAASGWAGCFWGYMIDVLPD